MAKEKRKGPLWSWRNLKNKSSRNASATVLEMDTTEDECTIALPIENESIEKTTTSRVTGKDLLEDIIYRVLTSEVAPTVVHAIGDDIGGFEKLGDRLKEPVKVERDDVFHESRTNVLSTTVPSGEKSSVAFLLSDIRKSEREIKPLQVETPKPEGINVVVSESGTFETLESVCLEPNNSIDRYATEQDGTTNMIGPQDRPCDKDNVGDIHVCSESCDTPHNYPDQIAVIHSYLASQSMDMATESRSSVSSLTSARDYIGRSSVASLPEKAFHFLFDTFATACSCVAPEYREGHRSRFTSNQGRAGKKSPKRRRRSKVKIREIILD